MRCTIGVGRNIDDNGLREDEIDYLLTNDLHAAMADLDHNLPWWRSLDPVRQRVMANMMFGMGWPTFSQFARFFSAVHQHRWSDAATEMINSRWHNQVGDRALRLEQMMRTGNAAP